MLAGERPVFFYGQSYMGSLDAGLVALAFALFGPSVLAIRLVQAALYSGTVATASLIAWRVIDRPWGIWACGLILAVPTVNITLYSTVSLGGYGEVLLIGNLLLLLALIPVRHPASPWLFAAWGLLAGLGWWTSALIVVYALPVGVFLGWVALRRLSRRRALVSMAAVVLGLGLGGAPWLAWAWTHGSHSLLSESTGSAIAGASPPGFLSAVGSHLANLLVLGSTVVLGARPPWEVRWLAVPLLPVAIAFWLAALLHGAASLRRAALRPAHVLLIAVASLLLLGFLLTPFGADPSGRYFLPLGTPMAVLAGSCLSWLADQGARRLAWLLLVGLLAFHAWGTLDCALRPARLTTQFDANARYDHAYDAALIEFLRVTGEKRGYTSYWLAYPLAFLSDEELVFVPRLPYHPDLRYTPRDDRYGPYDEQVAASPRVAYITARHPLLDDRLRAGFARLGVSWQEAVLGDYRVFYDLTRAVRPQELGLGEASP